MYFARKDPAGRRCILKYQGKLNANTNTLQAYTNTAKLDFGPTAKRDSRSNSAHVYSGHISFYKKDSSGNDLAGAKFVVKNQDGKYAKLTGSGATGFISTSWGRRSTMRWTRWRWWSRGLLPAEHRGGGGPDLSGLSCDDPPAGRGGSVRYDVTSRPKTEPAGPDPAPDPFHLYGRPPAPRAGALRERMSHPRIKLKCPPVGRALLIS